MVKLVVSFALLLSAPSFALRLTCADDYAGADAYPLHVDVDDLVEMSPDWERALKRMQREGVLKPERSWMMPTSLIRDFNAEAFSVAWEYSKRFAPAHAYFQLLIAIADILSKAYDPHTASYYLASVLNRPPELQPQVNLEPSADDLFTSGLGSVWNYMIVFYLLFSTEGAVLPHESAFHQVQNKWLLALRNQLASLGRSYPTHLMQQYLPTWFSLAQGRQFSAMELPSADGQTFQATLDGTGFFRRHKDQEFPLGRSVLINVRPGGATLGPEDAALLLRTDHLTRASALTAKQIAYSISLEGKEIGVGLRIDGATRAAIGELVGNYMALSRALPQRAPERARQP
ncbi:MAG: hypothetical protein R3B54_15435 [Bdellovibrionota bacterium]